MKFNQHERRKEKKEKKNKKQGEAQLCCLDEKGKEKKK